MCTYTPADGDIIACATGQTFTVHTANATFPLMTMDHPGRLYQWTHIEFPITLLSRCGEPVNDLFDTLLV